MLESYARIGMDDPGSADCGRRCREPPETWDKSARTRADDNDRPSYSTASYKCRLSLSCVIHGPADRQEFTETALDEASSPQDISRHVRL